MTNEEFASNFLLKKNELMNSKVSDLTIYQLEMLFCMWANKHLSIEKSEETNGKNSADYNIVITSR